jgi:hypothetical protein
MVTLKTDDGIEVEGRDLKQAGRLMKKAIAKRQIDQKERDSRWGNAMDRARANAWTIFTRQMSEGRPSWHFSNKYHALVIGNNGDRVTYNSASGTVEFEHNGYRVSGFLTNGGGYDIAVRLTPIPDCNGWSGKGGWFAVGIDRDRVALEPMEYYPILEFLDSFITN